MKKELHNKAKATYELLDKEPALSVGDDFYEQLQSRLEAEPMGDSSSSFSRYAGLTAIVLLLVANLLLGYQLISPTETQNKLQPVEDEISLLARELGLDDSGVNF